MEYIWIKVNTISYDLTTNLKIDPAFIVGKVLMVMPHGPYHYKTMYGLIHRKDCEQVTKFYSLGNDYNGMTFEIRHDPIKGFIATQTDGTDSEWGYIDGIPTAIEKDYYILIYKLTEIYIQSLRKDNV